MSEKAFPLAHPRGGELDYYYQEGISVRDYFAAKAMVGLISSLTAENADPDEGGPVIFKDAAGEGVIHLEIAQTSYDLADAMMNARKGLS